MADKGQTLLFIPDISGFTDFVKSTEIEHSKHIISELLELIINTDSLGMVVSEIEGDAVFFYKKGIPEVGDIIKQVQAMFLKFHNYLKRYETERICRCGACQTAGNLSLKFIVHSGNVETLKVKGHEKLHGADVIVVHRLLKNQIKANEYVLMTEPLINGNGEVKDMGWVNLQKGSEEYENLGNIDYYFSELKVLHGQVDKAREIKFPTLSSGKVAFDLFIQAPVDEIFESFTNLEKRKEWNKDISDIIMRDDKIGSGSVHTCIVGKNYLDIETIGRLEHLGKITYGERLNEFKGLKDIITIFTFEEDKGATKISVELDFKASSLITKILKPLIKKSFQKQTMKGLLKLKEVSEKQAN